VEYHLVELRSEEAERNSSDSYHPDPGVVKCILHKHQSQAEREAFFLKLRVGGELPKADASSVKSPGTETPVFLYTYAGRRAGVGQGNSSGIINGEEAGVMSMNQPVRGFIQGEMAGCYISVFSGRFYLCGPDLFVVAFF
jgi:hypothetical protein